MNILLWTLCLHHSLCSRGLTYMEPLTFGFSLALPMEWINGRPKVGLEWADIHIPCSSFLNCHFQLWQSLLSGHFHTTVVCPYNIFSPGHFRLRATQYAVSLVVFPKPFPHVLKTALSLNSHTYPLWASHLFLAESLTELTFDGAVSKWTLQNILLYVILHHPTSCASGPGS